MASEQKSLLDILFEHGIDTYRQPIYTDIPTSASKEIAIATQLSKPLGLLYGLSIYADGITPTNDTLITQPEAESIFLNLKDGQNDFIYPIRLDELLFVNSGFPSTNSQRYLPVNINANFDLSTSFYANPGGIISNVDSGTKKIMLNLWYISTDSYVYLMNKGVVKQDVDDYLKKKR